MPALAWRKLDRHDTEHNDQTADLLAGHWAEIGPDYPGTDWTVTILRAELPYCDQLTVYEAKATSEAHAKAAVMAWRDNYHRHAVYVRQVPGTASWTWGCRECLGMLAELRPTLALTYPLAADHAVNTDCEHLWNEWLVGVR